MKIIRNSIGILIGIGLLVGISVNSATVLNPIYGGTGASTTPQVGQLLIGTSGKIYVPAWLTAGSNITIATSSGGITISSTGGGNATTTINGASGPTFTFSTSTSGFIIATSTGTITFGFTETDPIWQASSSNYYLGSYINTNYLATGTAATTYYLQTNPSGYITDGNTGWDNSYGFITATTTSLTGYYTTSTIDASSSSWTSDIYWTGTATNLVAATGRTSLGLGTMAVANTTDYLATGTAASTYVARSNWTTIDNYPTACSGGQAVYGLGDTLSCTTDNATTGSAITGFAGTLAYDHGGTGTSTALALQNLWWGDGTGNLVQVASSTLAGAGGVSSLNTYTGALTLWGTDNQLTITASGTVGLIASIPDSLYIGTDDNATGSIMIYGDNADSGGYLRIYNSVNNDDQTEYWQFTPAGAGDTSFTLGIDDDVDVFKFYTAGNFSAIGNVAGATYGSDASVSDTELKYINTLSSNAQTQLTTINGWASSSFAWATSNTAWINSTGTNSASWASSSYNWGDHSLAGYLTSYDETDPFWDASSSEYAKIDLSNLTTNSDMIQIESATGATSANIIIRADGELDLTAEGSGMYFSQVGEVYNFRAGIGGTSGILDFNEVIDTDKTFTFPNASGTLITTGNLTDITNNATTGTFTAGDALTLTGTDFDFDGGASPGGSLGGTWAAITVDSDAAWTGHNSYPAACTGGQAVIGLADTLTCSTDNATTGTAWTTTNISGLDISDDTNLAAGRSLTLSGDSVELDAEIYSKDISISIYNASDTMDAIVQKSFSYPITITKIECSVNNTSSSTIQFDERAYATPNTGGTDVMSAALVCDSDSASTTSFANATIAAEAPLSLDVDTITGTVSALRIHVFYTIND